MKGGSNTSRNATELVAAPNGLETTTVYEPLSGAERFVNVSSADCAPETPPASNSGLPLRNH